MNKLSISNLSVTFSERKILNNINLEIPEGSSIVILGESGSGKSVLLKSIVGLIKKTSGKILLDGKNVDNDNELINNFGILFQNGALFCSLTIWENVVFNFSHRFGLKKKEAKSIAIQKLEDVGLGESIAELLPSEISGGMRKRVSLARTLVNQPKILMLDEPTSGLDPITSDIVNKTIQNIAQKNKVTILTITHNVRTAFEVANSIAVLKNGTIDSIENVENAFKGGSSYMRKFMQLSKI